MVVQDSHYGDDVQLLLPSGCSNEPCLSTNKLPHTHILQVTSEQHEYSKRSINLLSLFELALQSQTPSICILLCCAIEPCISINKLPHTHVPQVASEQHEYSKRSINLLSLFELVLHSQTPSICILLCCAIEPCISINKLPHTHVPQVASEQHEYSRRSINLLSLYELASHSQTSYLYIVVLCLQNLPLYQ